MAPDLLDSGASGTGLRCIGLGKVLAEYHKVRILARGDPDLPVGGARLLTNPHEKRRALREAELIVTANGIPRSALPTVRGQIAFDLYDPNLIEALTVSRSAAAEAHVSIRATAIALRYAVRYGDYILCANEPQRDLYLGLLLGNHTAKQQAKMSAAQLLATILVVPSGIDDVLPVIPTARQQLGLAEDDIVLLWGGGIWDWLDPFTIVDALVRAIPRAPSLKLLFLGLCRGQTDDPHATRVNELMERCRATGLLGTAIRINEQWVTSSERATYLAASDAGVIGQGDHLEARYSFRTRLLDCLWAGLPVLASGLDPFTAQGIQEGWADARRAGSVEEFANLLVRFASDATWRRELSTAARNARPTYTWECAARPLVAVAESARFVSWQKRMYRGVAATTGALRNHLRLR